MVTAHGLSNHENTEQTHEKTLPVHNEDGLKTSRLSMYPL